MKKCILIVCMIALVLAGCTRNNATPNSRLDERLPGADTSGNITAKYMGNFGNGPFGSVTGAAAIYLVNGQYTLALENVAISNGPDLHVYLSKEVQPLHFIDLGKLKATSGNQLYAISSVPDFAAYKYALIHCQQYNHLFGSAELK